MQRVLSFQMSRNIDESSEYVTKRLCFSFLFSVGFLCLLCGFLLGRFAAERSMETQAQKTRDELAGNGLQKTEYLQQLALVKLEEASFGHDRMTDWQRPDMLEANMRRINEFFSNLSFAVTNHAACIHATVRGSLEPDRYVILSANGDGVAVALELGQVLDGPLQPRRSLIFCLSLVSSDVCPQTLPAFLRQKVMAYVTVHGRLTRANDQVALSGSDVMRSITAEAIKTIPGDWTYLEREIFGPRLFLDVPHVTFSFNDSNPAHGQTYRNQSSQSRDITLAKMISQTIWQLSESIVIRWEPKYFNETVNVILGSIDTSKFRDAKEKLKRTRYALKALLAAVEDLNTKIDMTENTQALRVRIWNDLLLDLDKALLCPDENSHSRTDLTILRQLALESSNDTLTYLDEMTKCYEDAIQILQER